MLWNCLYNYHEDYTFITMMGVNTTTFHAILKVGFGGLWYANMIIHTNTQTAGQDVEAPDAWFRGNINGLTQWLGS